MGRTMSREEKRALRMPERGAFLDRRHGIPAALVLKLIFGAAMGSLWLSPISALVPHVTAEDAAADLYRSGDVEGGRREFRRLVQRRSAEREPQPWHARVSPQKILRISFSALNKSVHTIECWERAEASTHIQKGREIPPAVASEIVAAVTDLLAYADVISASAGTLVGADAEEIAEGLDRRKERFGTLLLKTIAFARDTGMQDVRAMMLERARPFIDVPESLQAFDAENPQLSRVMEVDPIRKTPRPLPPDRGWTEVEQSHPIAVLASDPYQALENGDPDEVRSLLVEGYWPEEEITRAMQKKSGYQLLSVKEVQIRNLGGGEYEVWVGEVTEVTPEGVTKSWDDRIIVRRTPDGEYRVSYGRSKSARDAERDGKE